MPFLKENIDRAIVITQHDLGGFLHPLGFREAKLFSAKNLYCLTNNFTAIAIGFCNDNYKPTDESYVSFRGSSFEDYLNMCKKFASACDPYQKDAIMLIIPKFVKQSRQLKAKVDAGEMEETVYLKTLDKDNEWGRAVLALAEAFEVTLE
jgi:hypothetical protein